MEKSTKTDNFLQAIKKYADQQRNAMREEVEHLKEEKLNEAKQKAKRDSGKLVKDKIEEIKNRETSKLAKLTQDGQKELFLERAKMTEDIFKKAEEKLIEYSKTTEYSEKLTQSAKEIANLFGNKEYVIYLSEKDLAYSDKLKALFNENTEISADKSIKIGGIKGFCHSMNIVADETLDSKLYEQRNWFIENSGLSVL